MPAAYLPISAGCCLLAEAEKIYATSKIGSKTVYKAEAVWTLTTNNAAALNYKRTKLRS
ncbi:MAG: hypothetical protein ACLU99_08555 [Alphaproteobacteria bacterium]